MAGSSLEHALDSTPIRRTSHQEQHDAAISLAEVALRRKWTEKFRIKQMRTALGALGIDLEEEEPKDGTSS